MHLARWHAHPQACGAPVELHDWLQDTTSLTKKLSARCQQFRVRRLHQSRARCLADEAGLIALPRPQQTWEREVLLYCDAQPVVFAHTVVPLSASATDWPLFGALGERSLGSTLFGDPLVSRGKLSFARLGMRHPLHKRTLAALQQAGFIAPIGMNLYARRCLYRRKRGLLLVTEVLLPWISQLPLPILDARRHF